MNRLGAVHAQARQTSPTPSSCAVFFDAPTLFLGFPILPVIRSGVALGDPCMHSREINYQEGQRATQRASEAEAMAQTMVANGAGMNPSESPYSEGDKVIIPQQSLVYEAKVGSENGEEAGDLDDGELRRDPNPSHQTTTSFTDPSSSPLTSPFPHKTLFRSRRSRRSSSTRSSAGSTSYTTWYVAGASLRCRVFGQAV